MATRKYYQKRVDKNVTAVQMNLDFNKIDYNKWGGIQTGKPGDWIVNNNDDYYTVDKEYFRLNYEKVSPGVFKKVGKIWAEEAMENGVIETVEGSTEYIAGDYLVFDRQENGIGYAISKQDFEKMYEEVEYKDDLREEQSKYIADTIIPKRKDYKDNAIKNRTLFYTFQICAIIAALAVTFVNNIVSDTDTVKHIVSALGFASALVAALLNLFKFQENWLRNQCSFEELDLHINQYNAKVGIYTDNKNAYPLLVHNYTNILNEIGRKKAEQKE